MRNAQHHDITYHYWQKICSSGASNWMHYSSLTSWVWCQTEPCFPTKIHDHSIHHLTHARGVMYNAVMQGHYRLTTRWLSECGICRILNLRQICHKALYKIWRNKRTLINMKIHGVHSILSPKVQNCHCDRALNHTDHGTEFWFGLSTTSAWPVWPVTSGQVTSR